MDIHVNDQRLKTVLDLSCGTGRFSEALRARFDAEVIGIDPSKKDLGTGSERGTDVALRIQ